MRRLIMLLATLLAITASASTNLYNGKVSAPLRLLLALHHAGAAKAPAALRSLISQKEISVSVQLTSPRDPAVWAGRGLRLRKLPSGRYAGLGGVYGARMTWDEIARWAADPGILQIESDWHPGVVPCLDLSAPEVGANQCWNWTCPHGYPITGQGQLVADFDTGIDVFHPAFFRPTELRFNWIDMNGNGVFNSGIDAVDMNNNGTGDFGESLRFMDGKIYDPAHTFGGNGISNQDGVYQADWDWLYNDQNNNGQRDYGAGLGFTENTPAYGEPLFYCDDVNHNNILDPGEQLIKLGESKVRAVMDDFDPENWEPIVHQRGIDLIQAHPDVRIHGTGVSGILVGGEPGRSRFCGLASGADLLMGYSDYAWFEDYLPWVYDQGCKVLLYEFGSWVGRPLDGSSNEEILMDTLSGLGVMQVAPAGNLNRGYKHCQLQIAPGESVPITLGVAPFQGAFPTEIFCSFLWREPSTELSLSLEDPYGLTIALQDTVLQSFGTWTVWSFSWVSPRGTAMIFFDLWGNENTPVIGDWEVTLHHPSGGNAFEVNGYVQDDTSAWEGGAEFTDFRSTDKTVTWPATADSAFVLGSYSTRGYEQYIGVGQGSIQPGQISKFSGRGSRIDGVHILSLAAPGNYDVYTTRAKEDYPYSYAGWRQFSGTSAAGPHVAACAVLAFQADTNMTRQTVESLLEAYTIQDSFTGICYNDTWGYGKIRIDDLVNYLGTISPTSPAVLPLDLELSANPNPFNSVVTLRVDLHRRQNVELSAWDLAGRKVADLYQGDMEAGSHKLSWNASGLASGIYWVTVRAGDRQVVQKVALVK